MVGAELARADGGGKIGIEARIVESAADDPAVDRADGAELDRIVVAGRAKLKLLDRVARVAGERDAQIAECVAETGIAGEIVSCGAARMIWRSDRSGRTIDACSPGLKETCDIAIRSDLLWHRAAGSNPSLGACR